MPRGNNNQHSAGNVTRTGQCYICERFYKGDVKMVNKLMKMHMSKSHGVENFGFPDKAVPKKDRIGNANDGMEKQLLPRDLDKIALSDPDSKIHRNETSGNVLHYSAPTSKYKRQFKKLIM